MSGKSTDPIVGVPGVSNEVTGLPMAGLTVGDYELVQCIAAGGMGEVFLARQVGYDGFEKLVVIKVLLPHLSHDPEFVALFFDEARIAARLNHPNIVQIFDLGECDGAYFIAMEYVGGESLEKLLLQAKDRDRRLPLPVVARIVAEVAAGLDHAHRATDGSGRPLNIVHRDVSPQNVLISFEGAVKIVDFGIAKAADRISTTQTGMLRGKIPYMSPEQAAGQPFDQRTDIFALGAVFFELATRRPLFPYTNDLKTLAAVTRCQVPPPRALVPEMDAGLEAILLKALAKSPDERYATVRDLQMALEEWLARCGQPVSRAHVAALVRDLLGERAGPDPRQYHPQLKSAIFARPEAATAEVAAPTPTAQPQRVTAKIPAAPEPALDVTLKMPTAPGPDSEVPTDPPHKTTTDEVPIAPKTDKVAAPPGAQGRSLTRSMRLYQPRRTPWSFVAGFAGTLLAVGALVHLASPWLPQNPSLAVAGADAAGAGPDAARPGPDAAAPAGEDAGAPDAGPLTRAEALQAEASQVFAEQRFVEAAKLFEKALSLDAKLARSRMLLGTCYARLERPADAARQYEKFLELSPADPLAPAVRKLLDDYYATAKVRRPRARP